MNKPTRRRVVPTWKGCAALCFVLALLSAAGCSSDPQQEANEGDDSSVADVAPLRLLVVDDPELAGAIQREWLARSGRDVVIRDVSTQELLDSKSTRLGADVIIYPSGLLGHLAARGRIEQLGVDASSSPSPDSQDVFELLRLREVSWCGKTFAVSLGSPQLTLLYRADVFQKHGLVVPSTWDEYGTLAAKLSELQRQGALSGDDGKPWNPLIEPLGAGWAGQVLLARAAAYAKHRNQFSALFEYGTMKPLIAGPAWSRAMEDLRGIADHLPEKATNFAPSDVRSEFLSGHCAVALTWPCRADDRSSSEIDQDSFPVAVAELPGSPTAYNYRSQEWESRGDADQQRVTLLGITGRLGSVSKESRQAPEAVNMLRWLGGELSGQTCPESKHTTLFRRSHLVQSPLWVDSQLEPAAADYGAVIEQALSRPGWLASIRIPGRPQYLAALDEAVHAVLKDGVSSEEALHAAAEKWEQITESLGRDAQREAYMRSIGLEP